MDAGMRLPATLLMKKDAQDRCGPQCAGLRAARPSGEAQARPVEGGAQAGGSPPSPGSGLQTQKCSAYSSCPRVAGMKLKFHPGDKQTLTTTVWIIQCSPVFPTSALPYLAATPQVSLSGLMEGLYRGVVP